VINSPIGKLGFIFVNKRLIKLDFLSSKVPLILPKNTIIRQVATKIKRYFCDHTLRFNFLINIEGTLLQKKIWRMLQNIPSGTTRTYGELAKKIRTSPRVIGNACRLNPLPIVIPCHRVVAVNSIGGFLGKTKSKSRAIKIKKWLLKHESS
jgi:methylated-DNA-[protein]-cysteine S-methyltransferase